MRVNKLIIGLVAGLSSLAGQAQQVPMYTHYMYNTLVINPAYAGSRDAISVTALHRSQWVDFKGAPMTQTLTVHGPVANRNIGLGLSVMNDKIGPVNTTVFAGQFSYALKLNEVSKLSFGVSAGASVMQARLTGIPLDNENDPVFQSNIKNRMMPVVGFGLYYARERFYAGISTPNLMQNHYTTTLTNGNQSNAIERRHYFLIAGTVLKVTDNVDFKPTTLVKFTEAAPVQMDLTASFVFMKRLLVGAMFRTGDAVGALVGFNVTQQFHIGYSYDWSYGLRTPTYNSGSHEIVLRYDFLSFGGKQIHSPRHF